MAAWLGASKAKADRAAASKKELIALDSAKKIPFTLIEKTVCLR